MSRRKSQYDVLSKVVAPVLTDVLSRLSSESLCLSSCCNLIISPRELRGVVACRLIIQVRNGRNEAASCEHYTAREPCNEAQKAGKVGIAFDTTSRKSRTCVRY